MHDYLELSKQLSRKTDTRIMLLIMDGLGGCELERGGPTELAAAKTPNLDELAAGGVCGLTDPIAPGFTPGSGPAHLSLFGYDPVGYSIGRGVLAAAGVGFDLHPGDVAARGNFATRDADGNITDRRAGRIPTPDSAELCKLIDGVEIDGVQIFVRPVKEHRFMMAFRGPGLKGQCADSDPQKTGIPPLPVKNLNEESQKTADIANKFVAIAAERLKGREPANFILTRGYDDYPHIPSMKDIYKLDPAAIAVYPDYRGVARIAGMTILDTGESVADEFKTLEENFKDFDFFFLHVKKTDSYGEDGNFDAKVHVIEETDALIPRLMALKPDVVVVTGDHSTPALLKNHSWHPVPLLLHSNCCRRDTAAAFNEQECQLRGGLGRIASVSIMPLAMGNALKLLKFGA